MAPACTPTMAASSDFVVQALKGEDITIFADGSQTRSFCYVDDLIEGFIRLMRSPPDITGPINRGNPGEFTMLELAETVIDMTGSRSKLTFMPLPEDDSKQGRPDIEEARKHLDWQPTNSLSEGLQPTIRYFECLLWEGANEVVA